MSALYDFSASGPGTFTFDTVSTFEVIGDDATRFEIAKASSISITVTDDASRREIGLEKRRIVCGGPKGSFILSSREEAAVLAQVAISYIQGGSENAIRLINEYFGSVKDIRLLYANYENISNLKADDPTLYCEDHRGQCTPDKSAYFVFGDGVSYCDSFYKQEPLNSLCHGVGPGDGRIRGGTTFRMLAPQLMGNIAESTWVRTCTADRGGNVQNDKERNVGNYEVSAQIPHCLLRVGALTGGCDFRSASPPKLTRPPSAKCTRKNPDPTRALHFYVRAVWTYRVCE